MGQEVCGDVEMCSTRIWATVTSRPHGWHLRPRIPCLMEKSLFPGLLQSPFSNCTLLKHTPLIPRRNSFLTERPSRHKREQRMGRKEWASPGWNKRQPWEGDVEKSAITTPPMERDMMEVNRECYRKTEEGHITQLGNEGGRKRC